MYLIKNSVIFLLFILIVTMMFGMEINAEDSLTALSYEDYLYEIEKFEQYNEAPDLKEMVKEGEIPEVEERVSKDPLVVEPYDTIGEYGETWQRFYAGMGDTFNFGTPNNETMLEVHWDDETVIPNIAKDWEISEDLTTVTFHLRKDMKWSDGEKFTTEDIKFWYEDVILNKSLTPAIPYWLQHDDELVELEILDEYSFNLNYPAPKPKRVIEFEICQNFAVVTPKHYLKQFHIDYVDKEELKEKIEDEGFDSWSNHFNEYAAAPYANDELPVLTPWKLKEGSEWGDSRVVATRNPYYWKVDTEGNQLPYIDQINWDLLPESETILMRMLAGEAHLQARHLFMKDYPLLMENKEKGNYEVYLWSRKGVSSDAAIHLNQTLEGDDVLQDIFRDDRFRKALSLAVNREEINEALYYGTARPHQATVDPNSPYWKKEYGEAYLEYNIEKANQLLDEMGLEWDNNKEWRLRPDGEKLTIYLLSRHELWIETAEMVKRYYKDIGVDLQIRAEDRSLWTEKIAGNEHDAALYSLTGAYPFGIVDTPLLLDPNDRDAWAPEWRKWMITNGEEGQEPTPEGKELIENIKALKKAVDQDEIEKYTHNILNLHKENVWVIGLSVAELGYPWVVRNDFHNFPDDLTNSPITWTMNHVQPATFYISK